MAWLFALVSSLKNTHRLSVALPFSFVPLCFFYSKPAVCCKEENQLSECRCELLGFSNGSRCDPDTGGHHQPSLSHWDERPHCQSCVLVMDTFMFNRKRISFHYIHTSLMKVHMHTLPACRGANI